MEAAFYFTDVGITVLAFYWLVKNALRKPGTPTEGLFAYYDVLPTKLSRAARTLAARRVEASGQRTPRR